MLSRLIKSPELLELPIQRLPQEDGYVTTHGPLIYLIKYLIENDIDI